MALTKIQRFCLWGIGAFAFTIAVATLSAHFANLNEAEATDQLPSEAHAQDIGDGGLNLNTVALTASTTDYEVWLARDHADNQCIVALALSTRNLAAFCNSDEHINTSSLSGALKINTDKSSDEAPCVLQVYLFSDARHSVAAAKLIPGSERYDNLLVRYGPIETVASETVTVLPERSATTLTILGKNSLS